MIYSQIFKRLLSSVFLIAILFFIINSDMKTFLFFLIILYSLILFEWKRLSVNYKIFFVGSAFLLFSFYTVYQIRLIDRSNHLFLFIILICISNDVGGYLFGKIIGGPKLTKISPNKTISGALGGISLSILFLHFYIYLFKPTLILKLENFYLLVIIIFLSITSQCGDLVISYFKRKSKVKNTGNIIPGHGGILDRLDGMIFVFPINHLIFFNHLN